MPFLPVAYLVLFDISVWSFWLFLRGNTVHPADGNRLCEFTRVVLCPNHRLLSLRCHALHQYLWYWSDSCHEQYDLWLHLPEDCHRRLTGHTILRIHTKNRRWWMTFCVSSAKVQRYPSVQTLLVSAEAIHLEWELKDWLILPWLYASFLHS